MSDAPFIVAHKKATLTRLKSGVERVFASIDIGVKRVRESSIPLQMLGRGNDSEGEAVIRPYTPITLDLDLGYFELVVKMYPKGRMSHHFREMHEGRGHSVARKLNSDGKVDTMQALHNLNEDKLASFEQSWKGNAERHLPSWDDGFNFHGTTGASSSGRRGWASGSSWPLPIEGFYGRTRTMRAYSDVRTTSCTY
ncbi:unnamed protein product [Camellia sinensis]